MARAFKRNDTAIFKMAHRLVYATDHPDVFEVIGSDGKTRYRIVLLRNPLKALCSCHAGVHENPCWHAELVLLRRANVNGRGVRKTAA